MVCCGRSSYDMTCGICKSKQPGMKTVSLSTATRCKYHVTFSALDMFK